ncbi:MAG TPA: hypothetical protein VKE40_04655, partial [Gemmataceae bacterium]|nr:hypothetical protein [Gemmataceae bacterium]
MTTLLAALVLFGALILVLVDGRRWTRAVCAALLVGTLSGCGGGAGSGGLPPNGGTVGQSSAPGMQPSTPVHGTESPPPSGGGGGGPGPGHAPEI